MMRQERAQAALNQEANGPASTGMAQRQQRIRQVEAWRISLRPIVEQEFDQAGNDGAGRWITNPPEVLVHTPVDGQFGQDQLGIRIFYNDGRKLFVPWVRVLQLEEFWVVVTEAYNNADGTWTAFELRDE